MTPSPVHAQATAQTPCTDTGPFTDGSGNHILYNCEFNADSPDTVTGGGVVLTGGATFNANVESAISGGAVQLQTYDAVLNANATRAITGGFLAVNGTLNLNAPEAVIGTIHVGGDGVININATDATSAATQIEFGSQQVAAGGVLNLNGFSTTLGGLYYYIPSGVIQNGGAADATLTLDIAAADNSAFGGSIGDGGSGKLAIVKTGAGTLTLAGSNTYTGGTTILGGSLLLSGGGSLGGGTVALGNGTTLDLNGTGQTIGSLTGAGTVTNNNTGHSSVLTADFTTDAAFDGKIISPVDAVNHVLTAVNIDKTGAGTLTLGGDGSTIGTLNVTSGTLRIAGSASYLEETRVTGGALQVDGRFGFTDLGQPQLVPNQITITANGAVGGSGRIDGAVLVNDGGTLTGRSGQTLTIDTLLMNRNAITNVALGAPSDAALFGVTGNLYLDGTLNISDAGGFGKGLYRLFDAGNVFDNGLDIGSTPAGYSSGDFTVQTAASQVNLLVGPVASGSYTFWDGLDTSANGVIEGGTGVWSASSANWTNATGTTNGTYDPAGLLIFAGVPGTVTVDAGGSALDVGGGMQFFVDGYSVAGDGLNLTQPAETIRVGDGTSAGIGMGATIASVLSGSGGIAKTDLGTLTLTGANSYTGGTAVDGGTLVAGASGSLGTGAVSVTGANLQVLSGVTLGNKVTLAGNGAAGATLTNSGVMSIAGGTLVSGTGDVINHGTLRSMATSNSISGLAVSLTGGTLTNDGSITASSGGQFGSGIAVGLNGSGTLINNGGSIQGSTFGVILTGDGSITNAAGATITGGLDAISGGGGSVTLVNAGAIAGNVDLGNTTNAVTLVSGGRITGGLSMGTNTASSLTLDGTGSQLYSAAVTGNTTFGGVLTKTNTGTWTIDKALNPGSVSVDGGTLVAGASGSLGTGAVSVTGANLQVLSGVTLGNKVTLAGNGAAGATLTNSGVMSIAGGTLVSGTGDVINHGTLRSMATSNSISGLAVSLTGGTLTNDGSITASSGGQFGSGIAVGLNGSGTLINNGGSIQGSTFGVILTGDGSITNAAGATITGGLDAISGGGGSVTLVNAGAIAGNVDLGNTTNAVTLVSGGRITGGLSMGTNTASSLTLDGTGSQLYSAAVTGNTTFGGVLTKTNTGTWTIDKALSAGSTTIDAGTLAVTSTLTSPSVTVASGGKLTGSSTIAGAVTIGNGGTLAGASGSRLAMTSLTLSSGAHVAVALGAPSDAALFGVTGNLTLDGTLDVTNAGAFGQGLYRLFDYGGTLTDKGLAIGATPVGYDTSNLAIQTGSQQINLLVGSTYVLWDGSQTSANGVIEGGTGVWSASSANWTNATGTTNGTYDPAGLLIFAGVPGTVTVDAGGSALDVGGGMQFFVDGYSVAGDGLNLTQPAETLRVGDGTSAGIGMGATIASVLSGSGGIAKTDLGTLTLTSANSYTGGTAVDGGTLVAGVSGSLGTGAVSVTGANLQVLSGVTLGNKVTLAGNGAAGATLTNSGVMSIAGGTLVSGTGDVTNHGTLRSMATSNSISGLAVSLTGGTLTNDGSITASSGGQFGSGIAVGLNGSGTLINNGGSIQGSTFGVILTGDGSITNAAGATITGGLDAISGGGGSVTLVNAGAIAGNVDLGNTTNAVTLVSGGRITGGLSMGTNTASSLTLDGTGSQLYSAAVTGNTTFGGVLTKTNTGTWTIDKALSAGSTTIDAGTLAVTSTLTSPSVTVANGGKLTGSGTIAGAVTIGNGGTLAGASGSRLAMTSLTLSSGAHVAVALGAPSDAALFGVTGNLTLDGTLDVANAGAFGQGLYRLFDYGGTLTDKGLAIGATPAGFGVDSLSIQTSSAAVNLLVGPTAVIWDGTRPGGSGTWTLNGTNWLDSKGNPVPWLGQFAIFSGTPGAITVDGSQGAIEVEGLQFVGSNWTIGGDPLTLKGDGGTTLIRVGDGTIAGAGSSASISTSLIGASQLVKDDLGTLILTGTNTYSGGTWIRGGTLQLGDGGPSGSLIGPVVDDSTLVFDWAGTTNFASAISGTGQIIQQGSGKTILSGDSSAFSGTTAVTNGTLSVNGSLGGTIQILSGGRLQGGGTVGPVVLAGTVAPGNSIGTLHVDGNVAFTSASTYEVEVDAAGLSDRIVASGAASIAGAHVAVLAGSGDYRPQTDYTILSADGGVSGTFNTVTSNMAFLDPTLSYDAGHVYLRLRRNDISFAEVGATPNQVAIGTATSALGWDNPLFDAVVQLSAEQSRAAFDQLAGDIYPSALTGMIEDSSQVRDAITDRLGQSADDGLWIRGVDFSAHFSSDGNAARVNRAGGGFLLGLDHQVGSRNRIGLLWGYNRDELDAASRSSSTKIDSWQLGAYAETRTGIFTLDGGIAYAWHDLHTRRDVEMPSFSESERSSYGARTLQLFGEVSARTSVGKIALSPYAQAAHVRVDSRGFAESGSVAGLKVDAAKSEATYATLGARSATTFELGRAEVTLHLDGGWRHTFGSITSIAEVRFKSATQAIEIAGIGLVRDAALFDAGVDVALSSKAVLSLNYVDREGDRYAERRVGASVALSF